MTGRRALKGLPLKANRLLLVAAIVCLIISGLSSDETLRNLLTAIGWSLVLVALVPFVSKLIWEELSKGKADNRDPSKITPRWSQLRHAMGIDRDVKVKVYPNLRNAGARATTIAIGQPVLSSLDSAETEAVLVHELAHIRGKHALKRVLWMIVVASVAMLVLLLLLGVLLRLGLSDCYFSGFSVVAILISSVGLAMPSICWTHEYGADVAAKQYVSKDAMVSALRKLARLRGTNLETDSYAHPSVNKRIVRLGLG